MRPLHKAPLGLLELFNLKVLGKQPVDFGEIVQPTIDVRDFYGANLLDPSVSGGTTGALLNLRDTDVLIQPFGLRGLGARLTVGAAGGGDLSLSFGFEAPNGDRCCLGTHSFATVFAGQVVEYGIPLRQVWPAGTVLYASAYAGTVPGADHLLQVTSLLEFFGAQQ